MATSAGPSIMSWRIQNIGSIIVIIIGIGLISTLIGQLYMYTLGSGSTSAGTG